MTGENALNLNLLLGKARANAYLAGHTHGAFEEDDRHTGVPNFTAGAAQNGEYRIHGWDGGIFSSTRASEGKWPKVIVTQPRARLEGGSEFVGGMVTVRARVFSPDPT
ncbi:MAG: hypothetical protein H7145_03525, partial [Akkermansiaceae bacterium]|nr:hypothetical protein [Armatimonadota bacterium]